MKLVFGGYLPHLNRYDMNLLNFIPNDHQSWMAGVAEKMGWEKLGEYYNRVFLMLLNMKPNTSFNIVKNVKADNYELFIKCAYSALQELEVMGELGYHFEEKGTIILRR